MADQTFYKNRDSSSRTRALGITQRATPLTLAWTGEMRVRFSDFQVNEIRPDGSVLHLKCVGIQGDGEKVLPAEGQTQAKKDVEATPELPKPQAQEEEKPAEKQQVPSEDIAILEKLAGGRFAKELVDMYQAATSDATTNQSTPVHTDVLDDRTVRGQIHQEIRRIFQSKIETTTGKDGAIIATFVQPRKGKKRGRTDASRGPRQEAPTGEYLHFTLVKDNRDTMDAVNQLARMLRLKPQSIGYAGTKDRRASTAQRCSVRRVHKRNLGGINGKLWGMCTGDYVYKDDPIHLGQLLGNEFVITLKNCRLVDDDGTKSLSEKVQLLQSTVDVSIAQMATNGWINYFGHQRFGTHQIGTHEIGKLILADKFEEAVNSILAYDAELAEMMENGEVPPEDSKKDECLRSQACMLFRTGKNINKAMELMPRRFSAEVCIIRHLSRQGSRNDFVGALTHITRGLRSMYLHAYQSHVWNHVTSKRWEEHGKTVVEGDLIIAENLAAPAEPAKDQDGDDIINPLEDDEDAPVRARPLTKEEAGSGQYTIYDIVLPTPGYDVIYPANSMGKFYEEFMGAEENGSLDPHKMTRMRREYSLPGRYRKVMNRFLAPPTIEFRTYSDDTEQMHPTDVDLINQASNSDSDGQKDSAKRIKLDDEVKSTEVVKSETTETAEPTKIAAIVKFQLGRSAYATVTLRELMGDPPEDD